MTKLPTRLSEPSRRVLAEIRHGPKTVEELAAALHLTSNAIRNQLRTLEEKRFVQRRGSRAGVSKPSILYAITLTGQVQFSTLYLPVLTEFIQVAEGQCAGKQLVTFMRQTGKSLARHYPKPTGAFATRVAEGARLIHSFGGLMEVDRENGSLVLRSKACPLAALTAENSAACRVIEGLLSEYLSASVRTCCDVDTDPRCCFTLHRSGDSKTKNG